MVGRKIVLTGALGGIGLVVLRHLHALGAQLLALDLLSVDQAKQKLTEANLDLPSIEYLRIDISSDEDMTRLEERLSIEPDFDLIALAAIVTSGNLTDQQPRDISRTIEVNLTAQALLSQIFLRNWLKNKHKGQIIFVSSWVDSFPWPGITPYAASKAGLKALCRGIARENARFGIRANLISPGIVDVGMAAKQWREESDYRARASRAIPLGRLQDPQEVASGIAFLLGEDARYMTGSTLLMDGGASLYPMDPEEAG